jgi:hypothetical protein
MPHGSMAELTLFLVRAWAATWACRIQAAKIAYGGINESGERSSSEMQGHRLPLSIDTSGIPVLLHFRTDL